jgi:YaeQ protein
VRADAAASLLLTRLQAEKIHRAETIQINTFDRELIPSLCARLTRRMSFGLVLTERDLYVSVGEETISGSLVRHGIGKR